VCGGGGCACMYVCMYVCVCECRGGANVARV